MTSERPTEGDAQAPRRRRLYEPPESPTADAPGAVEERHAPAARSEDRGVPLGKEAEAARIVQNYVYWSGGIGVLAIPVLSTAAVLGIQIKMLSELSRLYGVPFSRQRGKALIAALAGGVGTVAIGRPLLAHVLALAFPLGWPVFQAASAGADAAATYAIGRVFTHHFGLGGTLLDFRPEETRAFFEAQIRRRDAR